MNVSRWSGRDDRIGKEVAQYTLRRRDDAATDSGDPQRRPAAAKGETQAGDTTATEAASRMKHR